MRSPIRYVFLNKGLGMSVGKASAQVAHAVTMALIKLDKPENATIWATSPHRTIIILEARDETHMRNIKEYLLERYITTAEIIDEGVNEIDPHVWTAMATPILDKEDENVILSLSTFSLYKDNIRVTMEIQR